MNAQAVTPRLSLEDVEQVVAEPLRFKAKLAIGENAYASLRAINRMRELWDVFGAAGTGAAIAKSSLIASTFFAPSGLLGVLGIGAAATPIGWVAFAAIASGGACYGMYRILGNSKGSRVIEIPRYLNTPLDALGLAIFDLLAPLAIRMAALNGEISAAKRTRLSRHLVDDWGLDSDFVTQAIAIIEPASMTGSLETMAVEAATYLHANPDCNHEAIATEYIAFLRDLLEDDGPLTKDEVAALELVSSRLSEAPQSALTKQWNRAKIHAELASVQAKDALASAVLWTRERMPTADEVAIAKDRTVTQARQAAKDITQQVEKSVGQLSESTSRLIGKLTRRT